MLSHSTEELIENNIYDNLIVLSREELEAMDNTIVYTDSFRNEAHEVQAE